MGTVVLSEMADSAKTSGPDTRLGQALALGLALALPAALALFVLAEPIVSVLFEHGRFGAEDRARTAAALAGFALGLPFAVIAKVFGQVYFARQTPRLPLLTGCLAVLVAALAGYALVGDGNAAQMAACAASLAFLAQAVLLGIALLRDGIWRPSVANLRPIVASLAASAIMLGVLLVLSSLLAARLAPTQSTLWRVAGLAALCTGGAFSYGAAGWLLGAFGAFPLPRYLRKRRA
jgi:putative peptidoglycan lipid II flippase